MLLLKRLNGVLWRGRFYESGQVSRSAMPPTPHMPQVHPTWMQGLSAGALAPAFFVSYRQPLLYDRGLASTYCFRVRAMVCRSPPCRGRRGPTCSSAANALLFSCMEARTLVG